MNNNKFDIDKAAAVIIMAKETLPNQSILNIQERLALDRAFKNSITKTPKRIKRK